MLGEDDLFLHCLLRGLTGISTKVCLPLQIIVNQNKDQSVKRKDTKGASGKDKSKSKGFSLRAMLDAFSNMLKTGCQSWNLAEDSVANYFSELIHTPCTHIYCTFAYTYAHTFIHTHIHICSTMIFLFCSSTQGKFNFINIYNKREVN